MKDVNVLKNIKQAKQVDIIAILIVSLFIFGIYTIRFISLIYVDKTFHVTESEFRMVFNLVLSIMGIISCLLSYNSNKKEELFIIALMYTMFFIDIGNSKLTGYLTNSEKEYYAIITSFFRVCTIYISVSNFDKVKKIIMDNKAESMLIVSLVSIIAIHIEYNCIMPYDKNMINFYGYYNILLTGVYIIIAITFFIKSLNHKEYIYSVIGASSLMFSIKSLYDLYYIVNPSQEVALIGYSTILIGFITFIIGLFIELSQTIKINRILDEQRNLFIKIIDENKHSNVIICDENYNIQYKNKKATKSINEINNMEDMNFNIGDIFDLGKIFKGSLTSNDIEDAISKDKCYIKDIYIKQDNKILDLSVHLFDVNNRKYKVITIKDVTEKYELEKAMLEYETIKQEDTMKNEFFSNISHELKTPLNIIYSTNQLLDTSINKENFKELYKKYSGCLNINCKRMLRLIDNIVDMTKLDVGFKTPRFDNYDIVNIIEDMVMSVVSYSKAKDIELTFDTDIEELKIKCDLDMLERIVLNLISNAIKFSEKGGNILVKISHDSKWVEIKVKDNGIGIDPQLQPKIFDRFVQGDKSIRRQKEGSGIGLSLVKSFVDLMDGKIYLKSDGKNGTEFRVLLPNKLHVKKSNEPQIEYHIDLQRVQLELSDIYELY